MAKALLTIREHTALEAVLWLQQLARHLAGHVLLPQRQSHIAEQQCDSRCSHLARLELELGLEAGIFYPDQPQLLRRQLMPVN